MEYEYFRGLICRHHIFRDSDCSPSLMYDSLVGERIPPFTIGSVIRLGEDKKGDISQTWHLKTLQSVKTESDTEMSVS